MKKIILMASLIILTFSGCDIVDKYLEKDIATQVTGTWEGKEVLKINVSKIIEHQIDYAMEYFNEKGTSSAYLVVNDDDTLQMKGPGNLRLNLKKIVSTY